MTHPQRTPGDGHLMNGGAVNGGDEKPGQPLAKQQPPLTAFQAAFRNLIDQNADELLSNPPPAWIIATLDEATERLLALRDAGVSRVMCQQLLHDDLEAVALLGGELAPRVG